MNHDSQSLGFSVLALLSKSAYCAEKLNLLAAQAFRAFLYCPNAALVLVSQF